MSNKIYEQRNPENFVLFGTTFNGIIIFIAILTMHYQWISKFCARCKQMVLIVLRRGRGRGRDDNRPFYSCVPIVAFDLE